MIRIPSSEIALLEGNGSSLTAAIDFADELIRGQRDIRDFEGNQALAAVAVSRVAGVIRNQIPGGDNLEAPRPDLIVAVPRAAWLGQRVSSATGIDFMRLFQGEDGSVGGEPSLLQQYQDRRNVVVVASSLNDAEELPEILTLPGIAGRVMAAVVLIDERTLVEGRVLNTPIYTVFARQPVVA